MPVDISQSQSYYDLLGVAPDSSHEELRRAYRRLALKHHPDLDKGPDRKVAELRFRLIHEAYVHLNTPEKRKSYDERLRAENDNARRAGTLLERVTSFLRPLTGSHT